MVNAEIEKTLKKITDTQLVHVRLLETTEREWNKRFDSLLSVVESHERSIERLEHTAQTHERRFGNVEDAVRTMVASIDRLIKMLENFAKGRKRENGRRG